MFTVKKSDGKDFLIIDLSFLNSQIPKSNFRMEDHEYLKNLIRLDDFMAPIDLSNTPFSIPLHKDSKIYAHLNSKVTNVIFSSSLLSHLIP